MTVKVKIRISDDVLEPSWWPVHHLELEDGIVVRQTTQKGGVYNIPEMLGWPAGKLVEWAKREDPWPTHPEIGPDLALQSDEGWPSRRAIDLLDLLERGDR